MWRGFFVCIIGSLWFIGFYFLGLGIDMSVFFWDLMWRNRRSFAVKHQLEIFLIIVYSGIKLNSCGVCRNIAKGVLSLLHQNVRLLCCMHLRRIGSPWWIYTYYRHNHCCVGYLFMWLINNLVNTPCVLDAWILMASFDWRCL